jgi:hypothetical protein
VSIADLKIFGDIFELTKSLSQERQEKLLRKLRCDCLRCNEAFEDLQPQENGLWVDPGEKAMFNVGDCGPLYRGFDLGKW